MNVQQVMDEYVIKYHRPEFIDKDPISIPHLFTKKEDIEIAGFLTALISWGNRKAILANAQKIMQLLDYAPYAFVLDASAKELATLDRHAIHRTFQGEDFAFIVQRVASLYRGGKNLEMLLSPLPEERTYFQAIERLRSYFLASNTAHRAGKHLSSPAKKSAAKRFLMYLRWMVRQDTHGVDFGLWKSHSPNKLSIPLDVHSGATARAFGLLSRKQNDWRSVELLDEVVRQWNSHDPAIYDFAFFGYGVSNGKDLALI